MVTLEKLSHWLTIPRENEHLDFKEAKQQFDVTKLLGYCVAFANERGGHLVLGVTDRVPRKVVGTDAFQNIGDIKSKILEKLKIRVEVYELNHPDGRVLVFEIPSRPVAHPMELNGTYYMRSGEQLVAMPADQLRRIFSEGESWEDVIADNYTIDDLDHEEIYKTVSDAIRENRIPASAQREDVQQILKRLNLITDNKLKRAAVVLYAKQESLQYMQCMIKMARFKGINKLGDFIDNQQVHGNAFRLLSEADAFLRRHLPIASYFQKDEFKRIDKPALPVMAIREALINAICHRDYSDRSTDIALAIYDDRLEIWNSGELLKNLTIENLKHHHQSILRNKLIANTFYVRGWIEKWGSGTNKMIQLCQQDGIPDPVFETYTGGLSVVFKFSETIGISSKQALTVSLSDRQKIILEMIKKHSGIGFQQIIAGIKNPPSERMVRKDLQHLKEAGLIELSGHAKTAVWRARD